MAKVRKTLPIFWFLIVGITGIILSEDFWLILVLIGLSWPGM